MAAVPLGKMLDGATGNGDSTNIFYPSRKSAGDWGVFQVSITNTATVTLRGRASSDAPWVDIHALDQSDVNGDDSAHARVVLCAEMKATVSNAASSPVISAWISE